MPHHDSTLREMKKMRFRIVAIERTRIVTRPASEPASEQAAIPLRMRATFAACLRLVVSIFQR